MIKVEGAFEVFIDPKLGCISNDLCINKGSAKTKPMVKGAKVSNSEAVPRAGDKG